LLRKILLTLYRFHLPRMNVGQFLKSEAGDRYADVATDPATQRLCQTTLAAMARGTKYAGFENDIVVFSNEVIAGPGSSLQAPTLILHDVKDPMAPVDHVDWFVSNFPNCERISVHVAGHLIWVGPDADIVQRSRVRFLREHAKRVEPSIK
jgi:pimeloyl-ACP methyl ester carboxylesterase